MTLDIILLVLLALAAFGGWRSGAIAMVISIAVLIVAAVGASLLATKVGVMIHIGATWAWPVIGFIFTFLVLLILGSWVKRWFRPKHGVLRSIDGLIGALLGLARGIIVLGLLLALLQIVHLPPEHIVEGSMLYPILVKAATLLIAVLKPYIHAPASNGSVVV